MPISFRLQNFKAFTDTSSIDLAPVTVLCGANSSGKSSILKSMLLMKQSITSRRSRFFGFGSEQPLLFNGEFARLGSWTDVVHGKSRDAELIFSWHMADSRSDSSFSSYSDAPSARVKNGPYDFDVEITVGSVGSEPIERSAVVRNLKARNNLNSLNIEMMESGGGGIRSYSFVVSSVKKLLTSSQAPIDGTISPLSVEILRAISEAGDIPAKTGEYIVEFIGPVPNRTYMFETKTWIQFWVTIQSILQKLKSKKKGPAPSYLVYLKREISTLTIALSTNTDLSHFSTEFLKGYPILHDLVRLATSHIEIEMSSMCGVLSMLWENIRYLGPLREQPKRFYEFDDTGGIDIGVSGEFAVQVLAIEADSRSYFSRIVESDGGGIKIDENSGIHTLLDALNYWLVAMDLPAVTPNVLKQSQYELKVNARDDLEVSLPDVGFGVSQVLPIILEALRARRGDLVILEQPEIHLHPRVQAIMADFFIARAADGVRFLIESHSEYLVKRLCRRVAENDINNLDKLVNIIFVRDTPFDGSECVKLVMNEFGEISNWPSGFFDTNEDAYWVKASLNRRANKAKK